MRKRIIKKIENLKKYNKWNINHLKSLMWKKIYVVYPKKFKTQKEIMDYLEENGDVKSFTSLKKAKAYKQKWGGWINTEKADEELFKEIDEYTQRI